MPFCGLDVLFPHENNGASVLKITNELGEFVPSPKGEDIESPGRQRNSFVAMTLVEYLRVEILRMEPPKERFGIGRDLGQERKTPRREALKDIKAPLGKFGVIV